MLDVTGHEELLESNPVLRRSIDVRNPYVDPINLLQIELLRRVRPTATIRASNAALHGHGQRHRRGHAQHRLIVRLDAHQNSTMMPTDGRIGNISSVTLKASMRR